VFRHVGSRFCTKKREGNSWHFYTDVRWFILNMYNCYEVRIFFVILYWGECLPLTRLENVKIEARFLHGNGRHPPSLTTMAVSPVTEHNPLILSPLWQPRYCADLRYHSDLDCCGVIGCPWLPWLHFVWPWLLWLQFAIHTLRIKKMSPVHFMFSFPSSTSYFRFIFGLRRSCLVRLTSKSQLNFSHYEPVQSMPCNTVVK